MRFALAIAVYLVASISWASGDDLTNISKNSNTIATGDTTLNAGDVVGSSHSSRAFAFSHALGDVDINEGANCMGSEAWGSIIVSRQTNELNQWCAGLFYDLNGKHKMAAVMRCDIKEIAKHFDSEAECVAENTIAPEMVAEVPAAAVAAIIDEHEDREEQRTLDLAAFAIRQDELEARLNRERNARRDYAHAAEIEKKEKAANEYEFQQRNLEAFQQIATTPEGSQ